MGRVFRLPLVQVERMSNAKSLHHWVAIMISALLLFVCWIFCRFALNSEDEFGLSITLSLFSIATLFQYDIPLKVLVLLCNKRMQDAVAYYTRFVEQHRDRYWSLYSNQDKEEDRVLRELTFLAIGNRKLFRDKLYHGYHRFAILEMVYTEDEINEIDVEI